MKTHARAVDSKNADARCRYGAGTRLVFLIAVTVLGAKSIALVLIDANPVLELG